ncbi:AlpA family transcriptional regulator [Limnohabitans sp.]|uniref:AlpA family transcriptional regulator n=1 Tax=Limnohabitans sp. TaxID=1907725 RepID=UPI0035B23332
MSQINQYPSTLLRRPQVESMTGLKRSSIYSLMKCGQFPHPVKLSARAVAWRSDDIPDGHPNSPIYGHLKLPHLS